MIANEITTLYRADIFKCKADALEMRALVLTDAMKREEGSAERSELIDIAIRFGNIATQYDLMMEPSQKQRDYWTLIQPFYETQR